jgi:hypothetical protein
MYTYRFTNKGWGSYRSGLACKDAIDESSTGFGVDNSETKGPKPATTPKYDQVIVGKNITTYKAKRMNK